MPFTRTLHSTETRSSATLVKTITPPVASRRHALRHAEPADVSRRVRTTIETIFLMVMFLALAGTGLFLRASLGFFD